MEPESCGLGTLHLPARPQDEHAELVRQAEQIKQAYWLPPMDPDSVDHDRIPIPLGGNASWKLWRVCVKVK
jgi:hypothetical protein